MVPGRIDLPHKVKNRDHVSAEAKPCQQGCDRFVSCSVVLDSDSRFLHRDRHQNALGGDQANVLATRQLELTRLFPAEAKPQEAIAAHEANGTDDSVRAIAFGVGVVHLDDVLVGVLHRASENSIHGVGS